MYRYPGGKTMLCALHCRLSSDTRIFGREEVAGQAPCSPIVTVTKSDGSSVRGQLVESGPEGHSTTTNRDGSRHAGPGKGPLGLHFMIAPKWWGRALPRLSIQ